MCSTVFAQVEGSQLEILGTVELDMTVGGITAKQLFYICSNLKQSALLGMDFSRDNGCVVDFNRETLQAGSIQVKLRKLGSAQGLTGRNCHHSARPQN